MAHESQKDSGETSTEMTTSEEEQDTVITSSTEESSASNDMSSDVSLDTTDSNIDSSATFTSGTTTELTEETTTSSSSSVQYESTTSTKDKPTTSSSKKKEKPKKKPAKKASDKKKKPVKKKQVSKATKPKQMQGPTLSNQAVFKTTANETNQQFIMKIGNQARKIAHKNDLYASIMIAQACLESNYGKSTLASEPNYNLFGIKGSYKGKSVNMLTQEDTSKGFVSLTSHFRKYSSYEESLKDYVALMKQGTTGNSQLYHSVFKKNSKKYEDATQALTGVYATDRQYHTKLNAIIDAYDLTRFDKSLTEKIEYKVKSNDTLASIATANKTEIEDIKRLNPSIQSDKELKKDFILNLEKDILFAKPLNGVYQVSSDFGSRGSDHHNGIDLAIKANSPVFATGEGIVEQIGTDPSAGNYIIIKHNYGLYSSYFHLNQINVKKGQTINMSQKIGLVGSTGNSTGPHLHFAISENPWSHYYHPKEFVDLD